MLLSASGLVTALREFYCIAALLDAVKLLLNDTESNLIRMCPYCESAEIIKFGHKQFKKGETVEETAGLVQHPIEVVQLWYEEYKKEKGHLQEIL